MRAPAAAAVLLLVALMAIAPAMAECGPAISGGEAAFAYAERAYHSYLFVNLSYDSELNELMINASYANGTACSSLASRARALESQGPLILARARSDFWTLMGSVIASVVALSLGAFASVRYGRRLTWRLWMYAHRNYKVVLREGPRREARPSEAGPERFPLYVAGLFIVLAIGLSGATLAQLYWRPGPFSVIALLNSNLEIGDYPQELLPNSNVTLYVLIKNEMNDVMLYQVRVGVLNASLPPGPSSLNESISGYDLYMVIPSGHNATAPIVLRAPARPGQYKLLLLLYYYNVSTGSFYYSGLFNQLYFNVTG
ncbi:hypothetical protein [Acidilobus saccharovorans]|uniref:hypothetical protein n=1 Tax=Acidilobus saccharovorans TaxID=242703 RepID=UPI00066296DA|nr:hypothetical protein [Acidilobus saccharovorans]